MSKGWINGSTTAWRKRRMQVLVRDGWVCQICELPIDPTLRNPHPHSAAVHHTKGKRYGDDLEQLVAAHRQCNLDAGEPVNDPPARPMAGW